MPSGFAPTTGVERLLRVALWLVLLSVGHVRFGQDSIRTGTVRQADAYSFTSDQPWGNHEWASEAASRRRSTPRPTPGWSG